MPGSCRTPSPVAPSMSIRKKDIRKYEFVGQFGRPEAQLSPSSCTGPWPVLVQPTGTACGQRTPGRLRRGRRVAHAKGVGLPTTRFATPNPPLQACLGTDGSLAALQTLITVAIPTGRTRPGHHVRRGLAALRA